MKLVPCEDCGETVERIQPRKTHCFNCKRKRRNERERLQREALNKFRRCPICHTRPKCPDTEHGELNNWLYFENGEAKLSESGQKKFGKDYLEKLRCTNQSPSNLNTASGVETAYHQRHSERKPIVRLAANKSNLLAKN